MELWKLILLSAIVLTIKAVGFIWALNELLHLEINYSLLTVLASTLLLFCINGHLTFSPNKGSKISKKTITKSVREKT